MTAPDRAPEPDPDAASAPPGDRGLFALVVRRPVAIAMLVLAFAVFGVVSFSKLPVDLLPEINYPTLTVRTTYPGAAPEDVEDRVSIRLQETLSTLPNLVRSTSISRAETSDIVLDFDWGTPMVFAVQDVRDRLDSIRLPRGAERPLILRYDPNLDPILRLSVSTAADARGDRTPTRELIHLRWIAENRIKREIENLPGVAAVQVRGGLEEEIRVQVDPFKMAAQGLDPARVAQRLAAENLNASGGSILEGSTEYLVRTLNEFRDVDEIARLSIERRGDTAIRVQDIATVTRGHEEREVVTRLDGGEAVEIAIYREAGANIVEVAEAVRRRVFGTAEQQAYTAGLDERGAGPQRLGERERSDYLAWRLRRDVQVDLLSDQSTFIAAAVDDVKQAAVLGAALAVLVIWVFLRRPSSTFVVGLSIPISVVVTFAPMYLLGVSLNIMSLGGLALGVGMLVDNAIVVLESITRCREEGDDLRRAAVRGSREVAGAITASTLTTIAVFAPIVFVHGIAGQIFGDQAVTVVSALLVSLLVAVLFIPMLASREWLAGGTGWLRGGDLRKLTRELWLDRVRSAWKERLPVVALGLTLFRTLLFALALVLALLLRLAIWVLLALFWVGWVLTWPVRKLFDLVWGAVEGAYPLLLRGALRLSWVVVVLAAALVWVSWQRVQRLGVELLPEIHQGEFTAHVGLPVGTPLEQTDETLAEIDADVRALEGVELTALTVGVESDTLTRDIEGEHTARLTVRLVPEASSVEDEERLLATARRLIGDHPAVQSLDVTRPTPFSLDAPIQIEVLGHDLAVMEQIAGEVVERISNLPLTDVRTSVRPGHPEARITFDRDKLLEYGLDLGAVSNLVRDQVLGNVSTRFAEGDERIDVRVVGDEILLGSLENVLDLVVNPDAPTPVPLYAVADVDTVQGPAEIRRIGNSRAVVVTAAGAGLDLGGLTASVERELASMTVPEDVAVQLGGQKREMDEAQTSMRFALILAVFLVYVVMASQFESLVQPLVILLTVPLALVGVVFTLDLLGIPLSIVVFIGLIMLAGIVVNNAIVLIDRINQRRRAGVELREAVLEAGRTRLRPIAMTTATTVLGLLPLTGWLSALPVIGHLGAGQGAEIRAPMAIAVIAGLLTSTVLTLVVVPTVYFLVARLAPARAAAPATSR